MRELTSYPAAALLISVLFGGVFSANLDFDTSGKHGDEPHVTEYFTPVDSEMLFKVMCQFCCSTRGELCSTAEACKKCECCGQSQMPGYLNLLLHHADVLNDQLTDQAGRHARHLITNTPVQRQKICPCPGAQDMNELCLHWAFVGMCHHASYMETMCPLSCRVCC